MWSTRAVLFWFLVCAPTFWSGAARGAIVYSNTAASGYIFPTATEVGDEIVLAGTERVVVSLIVPYYADVPVRIPVFTAAIYANDGPGGYPGTQLWSQGYEDLDLAPGYTTLTIDNLNVPVPDVITWTVHGIPQPTGLPGNGVTGLAICHPPTIGASGDWFWAHDALGGWTYYYFGGSPVASFGVVVEAVVPEPGLLAAFLGMMGLSLTRPIRRRPGH